MDKLHISMFVNGTEVYSDYQASVLHNIIQFLDNINIRMPRFCYHDQLSIAGNCRMCLIESGSSAKPILACSTEVSQDLELYTTSILVKQAREQMLEFLLINHPLDCPICDQGGECDLQDLTYAYGSDRSRYVDPKRGVSPFYFGPLVKVVMTRCIQCTRCIRFFDELVGITLLGSNGRGTSNTISPYLPISSLFYTYNMSGINVISTDVEIIGNVADICPVGALTIRPGSYMLRVWEAVSFETLDILDSLCSNIRIDTCGASILRVLPRLNASINDEWITDKIRFCSTGLLSSRIVVPLVDITNFSVFVSSNLSCHVPLVSVPDSYSAVSWEFAYLYIALAFRSFLLRNNDDAMHSFFAYAGGLLDAFSIYMFKLTCNVLGLSSVNTHIHCDSDFRSSYLFSSTLSSVFACDRVLFLLAINVRKESPILNIRLSHNAYTQPISSYIFYIGTQLFARYPIFHIGFSSISLYRFAKGSIAVSVSGIDITCIVGRTFYSTNTIVASSITNLLFGSFHNLCIACSDIHIRELCILQRYNVRTKYTLFNVI